MGVLKNPHVMTGLIALGAFALVAFVQRNVVKVPYVGSYLPGGGA